MFLSKEGMETKVWILPYEVSSIDKTMFVHKTGGPMLIKSVPDHEESLVEIVLPDGSCVVAKADQIITAVKKCVL
jgi:hypothetical protein